jgi:hypothetical protein
MLKSHNNWLEVGMYLTLMVATVMKGFKFFFAKGNL